MNPKPIRLIHPAHRVVSTLLAGLMTLFSVSPAFALPKGEQVKHGDVNFERAGNDLLIKQMSSKAIVNYGSFDIGGAESVRFDQPSGNAAILNRVTGGDASTIAGAMLANGHVYLVNPAGILFSSSAQVDVGGLVASAMNLSDENFLSGRLSFSGGGGSVVNQGSIRAGSVALVGGRVENEGVIKAGNILLGAGNESVVIDEVEGGEIRLIIDGQEQGPKAADAPAEPATNTAQAAGDAPATEPAATQAASQVSGEVASQAAPVANPGAVAPTLAEQIRQDALTRALVYNKGTLDASGVEGGRVDLAGGTVVQDGTVKADGAEGKGGTLNITANDLVVVTSASDTTANAGAHGDGGSITIFSPGTAILESGAVVAARGGALSGNGGQAEVSGHAQVVVRGLVDLTAPNGEAGALLIDPRNVDIRNIVTPGVGGSFAGGTWTPSASPSEVAIVDLLAQLELGAVIIQTNVAGPDAGNITLVDLLDLGASTAAFSSTLTLNAVNNITINAAIADSSVGQDRLINLVLNADSDNSGVGGILINASIDTSGGDLSGGGRSLGMTAGNGIVTDGGDLNFIMASSVALDGTGIITSGGNISITGAGPAASFLSAPVTTSGGNVSLQVGAGTLAINGLVDASGGAGTGSVDFRSTGSILSVGPSSSITSGAGGSVTLRGATALNLSGDVATNGGNADLDVTGTGVLSVFGTSQISALGGANTGSVTLDTVNGNINLAAGSEIRSGTAGSVSIAANGATRDVLMNGTVVAGSGALTALAPRDLTHTGSSTAGGGIAQLRADSDGNGTGLGTFGGTLTLNGAGDLNLGGASVDVTGTVDINGNLLRVESRGGLSLSGDVISDGGTILLNASLGGSGDIQISASGLLDATGGANTGLVRIENGAGNITNDGEVRSGTAGRLFVLAGGASGAIMNNGILAGGIEALFGTTLRANNGITIGAGATTTGAGILVLNGDFDNSGAGGILLNSSVSGDGGVSLSGVSVTGNAGANITAQNNIIDIDGTTGAVDIVGAINSNGGGITVNAATTLDLGAGALSSGGGSIALASGGAMQLFGPVTTSGGTFDADVTGPGALTILNDITTAGGTVDISTANGLLSSAAGADVNASGGAGTGSVRIRSLNAVQNLLVGGTVTSGTGGVNLRAGGDLTVDAAVIGGGGEVQLRANSDGGAIGNLAVNAAVSTTGTGDITLRGVVFTQGAAGTIGAAAGNVGGLFTGVSTVSQAITSATGIVDLQTANTLNVNAAVSGGGGVTLQGLTINGNASGAITAQNNLIAITGGGAVDMIGAIDSNGGGITIGAGTTLDLGAGLISSDGGVITFASANTMTLTGPITTAGGAFNADVTGAGALAIQNDITTSGGNVDITTFNGLLSTTAGSDVDASGGAGTASVRLESLNVAQNLNLAGTVTSGTGGANLRAGGNVTVSGTVNGNGGAVQLVANTDGVTAGDLVVNAAVSTTGAGGVTLRGQNFTQAGTGTIGAAGGNISGIFGASAVVSRSITSATGTVGLNAPTLALNAAVSGGGGVTLDGTTITGNAGGTVTAQNNDIQVTGLGAVDIIGAIDSNGGDITIGAGTTLDLGTGLISSDGGVITVSSVNTMTLFGPVTTGGGAFNANVTAGALAIQNDITTSGGNVDVSTVIGLLSTAVGADINVSGGAGTGAVRMESLGSAMGLSLGGTVTSGTGGANLRAGGDLSVGGLVNGGGGDVQLRANTDGGGFGNLAVNAAVSTSGNGNITLRGLQFSQSGTGAIGAAAGNVDGVFTGVSDVSRAITSTTGTVGLNAPVLGLGAAVSGGGGVTLDGGIISGNGSGTLTAQNNDILVTGTGLVNLIGAIDSNGGDITIGAGSTLNLGAGLIASDGGVITLSSANTMTLAGPITTAGGAFNADVTGAGALAIQNDITTSGGNVDITTADGLLSSTAGSDVDASGGAGTASVRLESLGLGQSLQTLGGVTSGSGGVLLRAGNTVTLGGAVVANGGPLTVNADTDGLGTGNVVLNAPLSTTGGGTITLTGRNFSQGAGGTVTGSGGLVSGDFLASATIDQAISGNGGEVSFLSDAGLIVNAVVSSAPPVGGTGTLRLRGGVTLNAAPVVGDADVTLDGNGLDLVINAAVALGSNAELSANRDVIVNQAVSTSAGRNLLVTADLNNTVDAATTRGGVLVQGAGSLDSGNHLVVRGAHINDAGGLGESILLAGLGNTLTAAGNLLVSDNAAAPVGADVVIGGNVLSTGGNVNVLSARNIAQQGGADITSQGGDLVLDAGGDFTQVAGSFAIVENGGDLFIRSGGTISLESARNFAGGGGDIAIQAVGSITPVNASFFEVRGDQVSLLSTGGAVGAVANPLQAEANSLAIGAAGNIVVTGVAGFPSLVFDNVPVLAANTLATDGTVSGSTGPAAPVATGTTGGGSFVATAQAGGDVTFNSTASVTGAGVLVLEGNNVNFNNAVGTAGGSATVAAANDVTFGASGSLATAGGSVNLDPGNALTMASGSSVNSGNANIRVDASAASSLGLLDAGAASISVTAGSLSDANGAAQNLIGAAVRLRTTSGAIGAAGDALELQTPLLAADSAGGLFARNTGALTVGTVGQVGVNRVGANLAALVDTDAAATSDAAAAGDLVLDATGALVLEDGVLANGNAVRANGGNARVSSGAGLTANASVTATGHLSVLAEGTIAQNAAFTASGAASTLDVRAGGAITMQDGVTGSTGGGNLRYQAQAGDLTFATLTAPGSGNLSLLASGSILGTASGTLTGNAARLEAGNGVGSQVFLASNQIQLEVVTLAAQAGAGGISVNDASALVIGSVGPLSVNRVGLDAGLSAQSDSLLAGLDTDLGGSIFAFAAAGSLTVDQAVTADGSGVAVLGAIGGTSDLVLNAAVNSATGDIVLGAGRDLVINGVTAGTGGAGAIQANANRSIVMDATARLSNNAGAVMMLAGEGIQLGEVFSSAGNVIASASGATGFTDANGGGLNLRAASLNLSANNGPLGTGADPIETETALLAANAGGSIFLRNTGALTIGDTPFAGFTAHSPSGFPAVFAVGGSSDLSAGGTLVLVNDGGLIVEDGTLVNPGLGARAGTGNLLLQDLSGAITLRSDLGAPAGSVTVLAGGGISVESSLANAGLTYDLQAQGGDLTFQSGLNLNSAGNNHIRLQASGDVVLANVNAGAGNAHVQAGDDIRMAGPGHTVTATQARFIASDAVGDLAGNAPVSTSADIVAASAGAGGIHLLDANAVTVGTTGVFGVNRVGATGATTALNDGPLSGHTTTANGAIVQRNTSGDLTVAQAVSANGAGNVRLAAGAGGNILVNNTVSSGTGNLTVFAQGGVTQTAGITTGGTGTIDIQGNTGAVTLGAPVSTGSGNVRVDAATSVALGTVTTTGNVSIEAGTSITDNNGAAVNVSGNRVRLDAQGGAVGASADRIETAASTLAARGGAGGVYLENTGALATGAVAPVSVNRVGPTGATSALADAAALDGLTTAANGNAVLINSAGVTVGGAGISANGSGNVLVRQTAGDLSLNANVASGSGAISLLAPGAIRQNAAVTTVGNTVDVDAGADLIQDAAAFTTTGGGNVRHRAGGAMTVSRIDAGAGNVSLAALGGAVTEDGDAAVDVVANQLRVEGSGAGVSGSNPLDTTVGTLAAAVGAGGLNVENTATLVIGTVNPVSVNRVADSGTAAADVSGAALAGITASGNDIEVATVNGDLTVANAVSNTSLSPDDKVFLQARGANRTLQVNAAVSSLNGDAILRSSGNLNAAANITGGRDVALWADDDASGAGNVSQPTGIVRANTRNVFIAGENFLQGAAGQIQAPNGGVTISVNSDVNLGSLLTGIDAVNLAVAANNITVDTLVQIAQTGVLRARTGGITHAGGNPAARIEAISLGLAAAQDIGAAGNLLRVDTDFLSTAATNVRVQELTSTTVVNGTLLITNPGFFPATGPVCAELIPRPFASEAEMISFFTGVTGADVVELNVAGDLATGGLLSAGSLLLLNVGGNVALDTITVLGDALINVGLNMDVGAVTVGNNLTVAVGGYYHGNTATVGGDLNANIGADLNLAQLGVGRNATVVVGTNNRVASTTVGGNGRFSAGGSQVGNTLTTGGSLVATTGGDFLVQDVSVRGGATLNVGGRAEGRELEVGGDLDATVRRDLLYSNISVGRSADLDVGGNIEGDTLDVAGDLVILGGGDLTFVNLASGDADIEIDGDVNVDQIDTGSLDLKAGGSLTFDEINASRVNASIGGLVKMATVNGGSQATFRAGRIQDAGSLVRAGRVSLTASGDIGADGRPINLDTGNIELLRGNNVYVNNRRGGQTSLGLLEARDQANLTVAGSIVDGNGDNLNVQARSARLTTTGEIGTARDPLEINIAETLTLAGGQNLASILWGFFSGELGRPPIRFGGPDAFAPGIAVLNGSVSLVNPELNAILLSAESYGDDLVGFKFRNSVFGDFYFLHLYLQVSELADDLDLNYIDYILYGRALVTPDPELPPAARNPIYIGGDEGN